MKNELKEFAISSLKNRNEIKNFSCAKDLVGKKECYFSYFLYGEEVMKYLISNGKDSIAGFKGVVEADYLILDLDCKDSNGKTDLTKAILTLQSFIKVLVEQCSLNPEHIIINFSGNKGFHIRLHNSLFGGFPKNDRLDLIHKQIATHLTKSFDFFDLSIYQKIRLIRIPETINIKTNKRAIFIRTNKILEFNSIDDINLLLTSDYDKQGKDLQLINNFFDGNISFAANEKLVELKNEVCNKLLDNTRINNENKTRDKLSEFSKLNIIAENCLVTNEILNKAKSGSHLTNDERLFISTILIDLYPDDDNLIHRIIENQNDYDYNITKSKYENIKSLEYSPYNCFSWCGEKLCSNAKKFNVRLPSDFIKISKKFNQSIFVEEFILHFKDQLLYDHRKDKFFFYSCGYFKQYSENQIASLTNKYLKDNFDYKAISDKEISGIIKRLKMEESIYYEDNLDRNKYFINLKNGVFDLCNKKFYPHDPKYRFFYQFDVDFDPDAKYGLYENTLKQIFNNDQDIISFFLRWQCYILLYDYSYQKMLVLYGKGRNGKSLLLNILRCILGSDNVASEKLQDLANDRGYSLVNLERKFLNISQELTGNEIEVDTIKQITGGDLISARPIYKERIQFVNKARLVIATNILPRISNFDQAFYQRIDFIEFPNSFYDNPDTNLESKLTSEKSGILNLIISQFDQILSDNNSIKIEVPEKSRKSLDSKIGSFNSVLEWISECCIVNQSNDKKIVMSLQKAYKNYEEWCLRSGGKKLSKNNFKRLLEDYYNLQIEQVHYLRQNESVYKNQILLYGLEILPSNEKNFLPDQFYSDNFKDLPF